MKVSTRGRYALRVMIDLAEHGEGDFTPLRDIAHRQGVSHKYLESIVASLSKAHFVEGQHGRGGGYRLVRSPAEYTVGSILKLTETSLAPVPCLECAPDACPRAPDCKTLPMWIALARMIDDFFEHITIADLAGRDSVDDDVI